MTQEIIEKLTQDLETAKLQAMAVASELKGDTGTCNLDTPLIKVVGTNEKELRDLFGEEYGINKYNGDWYQVGFKVLQGQANKRTIMAREFSNTLLDLGWHSIVHYVID